jgi:hypothetical protein
MNSILVGAIAMACFVAGLFFLRFWKTSRDRFFLFFAVSFWIQATGRVIQGMEEPMPGENAPLFYLLRLAAFGIILIAIIDKNLSGNKKNREIDMRAKKD